MKLAQEVSSCWMAWMLIMWLKMGMVNPEIMLIFSPQVCSWKNSKGCTGHKLQDIFVSSNNFFLFRSWILSNIKDYCINLFLLEVFKKIKDEVQLFISTNEVFHTCGLKSKQTPEGHGNCFQNGLKMFPFFLDEKRSEFPFRDNPKHLFKKTPKALMTGVPYLISNIVPTFHVYEVDTSPAWCCDVRWWNAQQSK